MQLAKQYKFQDWDEIAKVLETNRTGLLTCVHYFTKLCKRYKQGPFTEEEDALLLEVVENCSMGNYVAWNKVCQFFPTRSKVQVYQRQVTNNTNMSVSRIHFFLIGTKMG